MIPPVDLILWINAAVILTYIPILCYLDIKYREVDLRVWIPMLAICTPIAAYMYLTGYWYPWYSIVLSIVMCFIFRQIMIAGYIEGADFIFASLISVFWVMSPYPTAHGAVQFVFYIYLMFTFAMSAIYVLGYNIYKGNRFGLIDMMCKYPGGFPAMIPISAAFIMSLVMG